MTITWTEAFSSFTTSGTGWNDYDIYTAKSVPKGAIALIAMTNTAQAGANTVGVRTDGSSLDRYIKLHEAEAGGAVVATMFVKVDSSTGYIETYSSSSGLTFYLLGYFTGIDFTEAFAQMTTSTDRTWTDYDIYTEKSVPKGSVVQCACINCFDAAYALLGVRTDGSSLVRYQSVHEAESSSVEYTDADAYSICVKSDHSTGKIEIYEDLDYGYIYHLGYFGADMDYVELNQELTPTLAGSWEEQDLTPYLDQDGRVCEVYCGNRLTNAEKDVGCRIKGSSLSRYILVHEGEDGYNTGATFVCGTDASGILETYVNSATNPRFYLKGYFKFSAPPAGFAHSFGVIIA